jgi:hypothetical protein
MKDLIKKILKEESELGFNSSDKTITNKYKIVGDFEWYIQIENYDERVGHKGKTTIGYMDGKMAGTRYTKKAQLPKSQITIGETDEDGMTTITIPYWLYKKDENNLRVTEKLNPETYRVKDYER